MSLILGVQYGTPITSTVYTSIPAGTIMPCGHGIGITSISAANPAVVTTTIAHGLITGDSVVISGTSTTPTTLGTYTVTVTGTTTFTIPVNVTVAGGAVGIVSKIPTRMLLCDGSSYLRTTYPALFAAIGTSFGSADGNSFNVPDFRGRFLRGVDGSASNDPDKASRTAMNTGGNTGNLIGSIQGHQFGSHTHTIYGFDNAQGGGASGNYTTLTNSTNSHNNDKTSGPNGGNETRPLNAYVNYCIAY
jgi:hypothetical protein